MIRFLHYALVSKGLYPHLLPKYSGISAKGIDVSLRQSEEIVGSNPT
jgi:hypothetical protein